MNSEAYFQSITLAASGHQSEAVKILKEVLRQEPDNIDAWLVLEKNLQDPQDKLDCLHTILSLQPDNIVAKIRLTKLVKATSSLPSETEIIPTPIRPKNLIQSNQTKKIPPQQHIQQTQFCWNCGAENLIDFNYCSNCRSELSQSLPQAPAWEAKNTDFPETPDHILQTEAIVEGTPVTVYSTPNIKINSSTPATINDTATPTSAASLDNDHQQNKHEIDSEILFSSSKVTITTKQVDLQKDGVILFEDISGFNGSIYKMSGGIIFMIFAMALICLIPVLLINEEGAAYFSLTGFSFFTICGLAVIARNSKVQRDNIGLLTITTTDRRHFLVPNISKIDDAVAAIARGKQGISISSSLVSHADQVGLSKPTPDSRISTGENEKVLYNQNDVWISNTRSVSSKVSLRTTDILGFEWRNKTAWWVYVLILLLSPIVISASTYGFTESPILVFLGGMVAFNRLRWLYRWGTRYQLFLKTKQGPMEFCNAKDYWDYDHLNNILRSTNFSIA